MGMIELLFENSSLRFIDLWSRQPCNRIIENHQEPLGAGSWDKLSPLRERQSLRIKSLILLTLLTLNQLQVIAILPALATFAVAQHWFMKGLQDGALRG